MPSDELASTPLIIPDQRKPSWQRWTWLAGAVALAGLGGAWALVRPSIGWSKPTQTVKTIVVDRGDVALVVTENGTLESADNATVRCEVEALVGTTGGANGAPGTNKAGATAAGAQQNGAGAQPAAATPAPAAPKGAAAKGAAVKAGAAKAGGSKAKVAGAGVASASPTPAPTTGAAAGATGAAASTTMKRPDIRSFNYIVEPHIPLRGATKPVTTTKTKNQQQNNMMMSGGGGRGGGGGGGRGGSQGPTELMGSTRIIEIIPEGTRVEAGDIVCELDSSAFRDELQAQKIRYLQAKSWVEQAKSILEVNEISLKEYQEGIYPQDVQLIRQYIIACRTEQQRTKLNLEWSHGVAAKGYRANAQVLADELAYQQAAFVLSEAQGMENRLQNFTMPRIMKARLAKIEAIKSDLAAQEAAFELESQRLKRLEETIASCTMRAPRAGIVVYANQTNSWGRTEAQIQEGVTVRQTQPIFYVPNPKHMRVKARINESKTSMIQSGQRVIIRIDAFPDRPLTGTVAELTALPAPVSIANLDVKVYFATINIDSGGFNELRPGLSAEVSILVDNRKQVTRIPLSAVHWVQDQAYAAVPHKSTQGKKAAWDWKPLELGVADSAYVEVLSGLEPGDQISADPKALNPPKDLPAANNEKVVADATSKPQRELVE